MKKNRMISKGLAILLSAVMASGAAYATPVLAFADDEAVVAEQEEQMETEEPAEEQPETEEAVEEQPETEETVEEQPETEEAVEEAENPVLTEQEAEPVNKCGENATWDLLGTDSEKTLTISGTGAMYDYLGILSFTSAPWYSERSKITKIVIEQGITHIGDNAFEDCTALEYIEIPDGVTSIGKGAFNDCSNAAYALVPASVTSIGTLAFYWNSKIERPIYYGGTEEQWNKSASFLVYNGDSAKVYYSITEPVQLTGIQATAPSETMLYGGKKATAGFSYNPENAPLGSVKWESSNTSAVEVNEDGVLTSVEPGKATITVTAGYGTVFTSSFNITVEKDTQNFLLLTTSATLMPKETASIATLSLKGDGKISYTSKNESIATVSSDGVITAKKPGTVKINVTAQETEHYKALTKTVTVNVLPGATSSVKLENKSYGIKVTWKKVTGAKGYYLYRGSTRIAKLSGNSKVSFIDSDSKTNGKKYTYKVVAYASSGMSTESKSATAYYLALPTNVTAKNNASKKITVTWKKNSSAGGYQIKYVTGSTKKTITVYGGSTVKKVIKNLKKGKTYKIYVRSFKNLDGKKCYSAWTSAKTVKITK